jgi:hypothetical protein
MGRPPVMSEPIMYGEYTAHPAAELFPIMIEDELDKLAADISVHGQLEPILVWEDKILDGRNRYIACVKAGVKPRVLTAPLSPTSDQTPTEWVISHNLLRRHLTPRDRVRIAVEMKPMIMAEVEARRVAKRARTADRPDEAPGTRGAEWSDIAAHTMDVSGRTVKRADRVKRQAPETYARYTAGETSLTAAEREITGPSKDKGPSREHKDREASINGAYATMAGLRVVATDDLFRETLQGLLAEDPALRRVLAELIEEADHGTP